MKKRFLIPYLCIMAFPLLPAASVEAPPRIKLSEEATAALRSVLQRENRAKLKQLEQQRHVMEQSQHTTTPATASAERSHELRQALHRALHPAPVAVPPDPLAVLADRFQEEVYGMPLNGDHLKRLKGGLAHFESDLIFLRKGVQTEPTCSTSNQFCPHHGDLEHNSKDVFHQSTPSRAFVRLSLKKITDEKKLQAWLGRNRHPDSDTIAKLLRTFNFDQEVREHLEGIYGFTWTCKTITVGRTPASSQ